MLDIKLIRTINYRLYVSKIYSMQLFKEAYPTGNIHFKGRKEQDLSYWRTQLEPRFFFFENGRLAHRNLEIILKLYKAYSN